MTTHNHTDSKQDTPVVAREIADHTDSNEQQERRKNVRKDVPVVEELRAVFHRLWTANVGQSGYSKRDWRELRTMLFRKFGVEL